MLNECKLCMNDILKCIYNYGVSEDQFYFIVRLIKSLYSKTNFFKYFDTYEKNKEELSLKYDDAKPKLEICYKKKYFDITISSNNFICNISKLHAGNEVLINLCSILDKENFFYQIGKNDGVLYYYDKVTFSKAYLLLGNYFLFKPRKPKEVDPKITYYFSLNDTFDDILKASKCIKNSSLKIAVTYIDDTGEMKAL